MGKNMKAVADLPVKSRALRGKATPLAIVLTTNIFTLVALLAAYYVIAFFAAIRVVPMTMGFVKAGSGVTLDMPIETVLSVWIVPALFLVALVFALVLVTMRALWRLRARAVKVVRLWAFGQEISEVVPVELATKKSPTKPGTKVA